MKTWSVTVFWVAVFVVGGTLDLWGPVRAADYGTAWQRPAPPVETGTCPVPCAACAACPDCVCPSPPTAGEMVVRERCRVLKDPQWEQCTLRVKRPARVR